MKTLAVVVFMLVLASGIADGQYSTPSEPPKESGTGSAGPKDDRSPAQHGAQPNSGAVRPGNRDGDSPSAAAGELVRDTSARRIFGLPVTAALVIGGVLVALVLVAGILLPSARRRERARGNGTYGRP